MIEIEIELTSNEKNVTEVFQRLTELLRNAENQGFNVKELELEVDRRRRREKIINKQKSNSIFKIRLLVIHFQGFFYHF